jgi:hypothetical protein
MRKPIPLARLAEAATMRRSTLYTWMLTNHDTFKDVVAKAVRPNWKALAVEFAAGGLTDADGKAPSDETTRQTWWKVRKTVAARQASAIKRKVKASVESTPPVTPPPPVRAPAALSAAGALVTDDPDDDPPPPKHNWTPTTKLK